MFKPLNITPENAPAAAAFSLSAMLSPLYPMLACAVVFILIDFATGLWAGRVRARRAGQRWKVDNIKAWRTAFKIWFTMVGIVMAGAIETHILDFMTLNLAKIFTGFICGVEFWSFLENAAEITDYSVFRGLKKLMKKKVEDAIGCDLEEGKPNNE